VRPHVLFLSIRQIALSRHRLTRAHGHAPVKNIANIAHASHLPTSTSRVVHTTPGRFSGFGEHATSYQRAPLKPSASAVQKATHNGNATYGGHEKTKPRRGGEGRCNTGVCGQDSRARDKTRLKQARHACLDHPQRRPSCPRSGSAHLSCSGRPKASVTESGDPNCR
jgi:hypothetical protein